MKLSNSAAKTTITVLAVLLGISVAALAGTLIYKYISRTLDPATVLVSDNVISPKVTGEGEQNGDDADATGQGTAQSPKSVHAPNGATPPGGTNKPPADAAHAEVLELYSRKPSDNAAFKSGSMFPGDTETKYYCVRVSHNKEIVVYHHIDIRAGCEKLAEVLMCRVRLPETGETLYDGLMRDMPDALAYTVSAGSASTTDIYYEITTYLDTSVGNEYQNKELTADFRWWVEDDGGLVPPPQTGDNASVMLYICTASVSLIMIAVLVCKRRKEGSNVGK